MTPCTFNVNANNKLFLQEKVHLGLMSSTGISHTQLSSTGSALLTHGLQQSCFLAATVSILALALSLLES